jgi:glycosyltransferase involved in cell wall biosynthesis
MNEAPSIEGVRVIRHWTDISPGRGHAYLSEYEAQIKRAESAASAARTLRGQGFVPDLICVHPGWGEGLFLKVVFPEARMLCYQEFYYQPGGADVDFDPEFPSGNEDLGRHLLVRNSVFLQSLAAADWNVTPTAWQHSQFPEHLRDRITIQHEGIDTEVLKPDPSAWIAIGENRVKLTPEDEVITFVNRNLEPYRGFHTFARALPELLRRRPNAKIVIVGGDDVSYGQRLPSGQTYRKRYIGELPAGIDLSRIIFVGRIPYSTYVNLLQVSSVHVYLTYPFVLSWSMLEAMSVRVPLVASRTPPVTELLVDGQNASLVDFFSPPEVVESVVRVLDNRDLAAAMSTAARKLIVDRYDLKRVALPAYLKLLREVAQAGSGALRRVRSS